MDCRLLQGASGQLRLDVSSTNYNSHTVYLHQALAPRHQFVEARQGFVAPDGVGILDDQSVSYDITLCSKVTTIHHTTPHHTTATPSHLVIGPFASPGPALQLANNSDSFIWQSDI